MGKFVLECLCIDDCLLWLFDLVTFDETIGEESDWIASVESCMSFEETVYWAVWSSAVVLEVTDDDLVEVSEPVCVVKCCVVWAVLACEVSVRIVHVVGEHVEVSGEP